MAKKTVKKTAKKKEIERLFFNCFTMNETKNGGFAIKPKFHEKFGVASIVITHHDGTEWELDEDDVLWANPVKDYDFYSVSGSVELE